MRAALRPLSAGWVAGSVRARTLLQRRLGADAARQLASTPSLARALEQLSATAYGRRCQPGLTLAAAQRAVADTLLWHLRVLAGWVPPQALEPLRALAAWFEIANVDDRLAYLAGAEVPAPFALGGLATAWPRLADAGTPGDVRARLTGSAWADPGSDEPSSIRLALRLTWGRRVLAAVPQAEAWAAGAMSLLIARERFLAGRPADALVRLRPAGVGTAWATAATIEQLRDGLPAEAAWVLEGIPAPEALWRGEAAWWQRVEDDARVLARAPQMGVDAVVGCAVRLGVDAWRTCGALESAARGGGPTALEVFDAVV